MRLIKKLLVLFFVCFSLMMYSDDKEEKKPTIVSIGEFYTDSECCTNAGFSTEKKLSKPAAFTVHVHQPRFQSRLPPLYHPPHPQVCIERINQRPYAVQTYHAIQNTHTCVANINNHYLPHRIKARVLLLEGALPPPYGKKLQQAIKKFAKKALNAQGNLIDSMPEIDEKIFKKFLKYADLDVQSFYESIYQIEKYKDRHLQALPRTAQASFLLNMIDNQARWDYATFTRIYRSGQHYGDLVHQLYRCYTQERFDLALKNRTIQQDPLWEKLSNQPIDSNMQSQLLLRAEQAQALQKRLGQYEATNKSALDMIYAAIESKDDLTDVAPDQVEKMIDNLMHQACFNNAACPANFKRLFFDCSGILKKYSQDPFVQKHFAGQKLAAQVEKAVNQALLIQDESKSEVAQSAIQTVLHQAAESLHVQKNDLYQGYQDEAVKSANRLIQKQYTAVQPVEMNADKIYRFQEYHAGLSDQQSDRAQACQKTQEQHFQDFTQEHAITPEIKGFMLAYRINPLYFSQVHGNAFQHHMTTEILKIFNQTAQFQSGAPFVADIARFGALGQEFNLVKDIKNTSLLTDLCWNLLDYGRAVALGLGDTVNGIIIIADDPIKYLVDTAQTLGKLAYKTAEYGYNCAFIPEKARDTEAYLWNLCKDLKARFDRASGPERVRVGTHFISETILTRRLTSHLHGFVTELVHSARNLPIRDLAETIDLIRKDPVWARRFVGDVMYHCEDEILQINHLNRLKGLVCTSKKAGALKKYSPGLQKKINAFAKKNGIPRDAIPRAIETVARSAPKTNNKFFTPTITRKITHAISQEAERLNQAQKALIVALKERIKSLTKKETSLAKIRYFETKYDHLSTVARQEAHYVDMIRAIEKYSKNLPKSLKYTQEVLQLQTIESGKMRAALSGEWLVEWDLKHSMTSYFYFEPNRKGLFNFNNPKLNTGHCDYKGKIEKYAKQIKFLNKIERDGYYSVDISLFDKEKTIPKTFFPSNLKPQETFDIVSDALKNAKICNKINAHEKIFTAIGPTKNGAKIKFVILPINDKKIKIITFYPIKEWIEGEFN